MKPRRGGLAGRAALFTLGNLLFAIGQFVFFAMVARFGDPLIVGAYGLATAILNPLFFLTKMGMRQAQAADASELHSFATYRKLRSIFLVVATLIGFALTVLAPHSFAGIFVFITVLFARLAEASSDLYYGLLLQKQRQDVIAASMSLRAMSCVIGYGLLYAMLRDPVIAMVGMPIGWFAIYVLHDLPRSRREMTVQPGAAQVSRAELSSLAMHLWPLAVSGVMLQLQMGIPRYFLNWAESTEILGGLLPSLQIHAMVIMLGQSIVQSLLPSVAKALQEGRILGAKRQLKRAFIVLAPMLGLSILLAWLIGEPAVAIVFGEGYVLSGTLLWLVALSWTIRLIGAIFQNINVGALRFKVVMQMNCFCATVTLLLTTLLWWLFGIPGVLWGMVAGNAVFLVLAALQSRTALRGISAQAPPAPAQPEA